MRCPESANGGPSAILDYRTVSGGFDRVEDLLLVEGIGPATLEALRSLVVVR